MKAPARHSLNQSRRVLYRFGAALFLSISCLGHVRAACHAIWASMSPTRTGPARTDNAGGAPVVHSEKVHTQVTHTNHHQAPPTRVAFLVTRCAR